MNRLIIKSVIIAFLLSIPAFFIFYTWWNNADPEKTCASCHEITVSHSSWSLSAHNEISCAKCHGTALENGLHSLTEKGRMVVQHFLNRPRSENIGLTEKQIWQTMDRCIECHQNEYAKWSQGGHSATYRDIFLNAKHNETEQLNHDCLRCHGMFFDGDIEKLIEPISITGPWRFKVKKIADRPSIPCLSCHIIHNEQSPLSKPDYANPKSIFYSQHRENSTLAFYVRGEKAHFPIKDLPEPLIFSGNDTIMTPSDPIYKMCVQCHAPSAFHQAGSSDDKTPTGVHEGISCAACHKPHSNSSHNSCDNCHPAISNCNIDVKTMNTSYLSAESKHDIHNLSCIDCHNSQEL